MESGVFVTFFDTGEARERALPPVGPLDHVVVRPRVLVTDRLAVSQSPDLGADIARWLEAELELQRATGEEPGGPKRGEMRFTAPDSLYVRFAVFGDTREREPMPELGPFAVVVVGRHGVEADGQLIATRTSSELAAWELTSSAGDELVGLHKPDIAIRSTTLGYHPQLAATSAPPAARPPVPLESAAIVTPAAAEAPVHEPAEAPPATAAPEPVPPPAWSAPRAPAAAQTDAETRLTPADIELIERLDRERAEETLRARIQDEERRRLGVDASDDAATTWAMRYRPQAANEAPANLPAAGGGLDASALLWRLRFAIIGILLLGVGAYGFTVVRSGGTATVPGQAGQAAVKLVGVGEKVQSARWEYVVNGVVRTQSFGSAKAAGVYYMVLVGATNRGTEGAQLSPAEFVLVDAAGTQYRAESLSSGVYASQDNPQSPNAWPQAFPVGKTTSFSVIFDVSPATGRGNQLAIADVPGVRVKLD